MKKRDVYYFKHRAFLITLSKSRDIGKVYTPKSDTYETSEDNGEERKRVEGNFGEKVLLEGWG